MSQKSGTPKMSSERIVKDIRRATRKQYSAEEKIRIVLDGLRGEHSIAELCRREGIAESLYYTWSKFAYPVCCQYDKSVIICRSGLPRLSNNASRFSAGFSRRCRLRCLFGTPALA